MAGVKPWPCACAQGTSNNCERTSCRMVNTPNSAVSVTTALEELARPAQQGSRSPCQRETEKTLWSQRREAASAPRQERDELHDLSNRDIEQHRVQQLGDLNGPTHRLDQGNQLLHHGKKSTTCTPCTTAD